MDSVWRRLIRSAWIVGMLAAILPAVAHAGAPGSSPADLFGPPPGAEEPVVRVSAQFTSPQGAEPARLFITAEVKEGWHIYSITQAPGGPQATKIELTPTDGVRLPAVTQFQVTPAPDCKREPIFDNLLVESHHGTVTWYAPIELAPGVDPGTIHIQGVVKLQACDPNTCMPQRIAFTASHGQGVALTPPPPAVSAVAQPAASSEQLAAAVAFDPQALVIAENESLKHISLPVAIALGFVGGLILNIMPCVLPVIGLKILSFVEQSGHSRRQALLLNIWYSLGLVAVFVVLATLAVFAEFGWGALFQLAGFSITLAAVVFVMGLSFLGVWEIPLPGFVGRGKVLEMADQEGAAGAFSKGVLTTVLATPCGAPFVAPALTWSVTQPPAVTYGIFLSMGIGMASPYLLIGAFPELIRFLPKPGEWMETFKQIMGFVLLGTVVFLLTFIQPTYVVPTVALLFGLWAACWWIGRTPPTAEPGLKARRWLEAAAIAGVVWIIAFPGLDKVIPSRFAFGLRDITERHYNEAVEEGIAARMAEQAAQGSQTAASPAENPAVVPVSKRQRDEYALPWRPFSRGTMQEALAAKHTVLVDFTANWCLTCKALEAGVLNTPEVRRAVEDAGVVTLRADWSYGQAEVTEMLKLLGSKQVPVLAIFPAADPNHPVVLRGGYTQQTVLDALKQADTQRAAL